MYIVLHAAAKRASEDCMKKAADVVNDRAMALPDTRKSLTGYPVITVSLDGTSAVTLPTVMYAPCILSCFVVH